jgi:hypothetical protein
VRSTKGLRARWSISFDAPMTLAVHLDGAFVAIRPLSPRPPELDPRWETAPIDAYLAEIRAFAKETRFDDLFEKQAAYRAAVEERFASMLAKDPIVPWFHATFGKRKAEFLLSPGLLTGLRNFGVRAVRPGGGEEIVQIMFLEDPDATGAPRPTAITFETVVHELAHSYVNPTFDPKMAEMEATAGPVFALVETAMKAQHYATYTHMVNEAVVRALVVVYLNETRGKEAAKANLAQQIKLGFLWTGELAQALWDAKKKGKGKLAPAVMIETAKGVFASWLAARASK